MGMKEDLARKRAQLQAVTDPKPLTEEELKEAGVIPFTPAEPARPARQAPKPQAEHRAMPQSIEAEKGVLSSIMNAAIAGNDVARKAMFYAEGQVGAGHFHLPAHREIWEALKALHEQNEPMDFITVTNELDGARAIQAAGGAAYVTEIATFIPGHTNIDYYCQILQEKHALRQIAELGKRLSNAAVELTDQDPAAILDDATNTLKAIRTARRIGELPPLDDMSTLIGQNMPAPPPELVQGILHQGSKLIIGGVSKGRKTWSLMDLGVSVATGLPWWGCQTVKGKVCYINFEIQKPFFARRFAEICKKKNAIPAPGMFKCWTLRGLVDGIEKMSANLIKVLLQEDYALIIFDPIYKALGDRDENKAGDVASMLNELEAIAVKTGAAIAFGAHYSKGNQAGKDSMDRIGGSGVFARDPDAILTMTTHEQQECYTVDATLRNFPPQKPWVVRWEWPLFERDDTEDPDEIKKPRRINSKNDGKFEDQFSENDFLNLLHKNNNGRTPTEFKRLAMTQLLCSASTFKRYWKKIKTGPYIQEKDGRFFVSPIYSPTI